MTAEPARRPTVDQVCVMAGRSRGECWGCPVSRCPLNVSPFQGWGVDLEVAHKAVQLLRSNRYWVLGEEPKSGRQLLEELGPNPELELIARLIEHRDDYIHNLAVEGVVSGAFDLEQGARLAGYQTTARTFSRPRSLQAFAEKVQEWEERRDHVPEQGAQRHSKPHLYGEDET